MAHTAPRTRTTGNGRPRSAENLPDFSLLLQDFGLYAFDHRQEPLELHEHRFVELVYVRRGSGVHEHNGRRYPVLAGDAFVIAAGEQHGYQRSDGLGIVNILMTPAFLGSLHHLLRRVEGFTALFSLEPLFRAETSFRHKLHLSAAARARFDLLLDDLIRELSQRANGFEAVTGGLFLRMAAELCRDFTKGQGGPQSREWQGKRQAVDKAIAFLETQHSRAMTPADVAASACLSVSHLSHLFKEATGVSLMDYLLRYRLERAHGLLTAKTQSVSAIAFEVGFHDPGYFSRAFSRYFGYPPTRAGQFIP